MSTELERKLHARATNALQIAKDMPHRGVVPTAIQRMVRELTADGFDAWVAENWPVQQDASVTRPLAERAAEAYGLLLDEIDTLYCESERGDVPYRSAAAPGDCTCRQCELHRISDLIDPNFEGGD